MSISRQNLTVVIVSFMSENVIHDCIQSIPKDIKIIIVDNSNNYFFKETIEFKRRSWSAQASLKSIKPKFLKIIHIGIKNEISRALKKVGAIRDLNPGPPAPKAGIIATRPNALIRKYCFEKLL